MLLYSTKVEQACCQAPLQPKRQSHAACNWLEKATKKKKAFWFCNLRSRRKEEQADMPLDALLAPFPQLLAETGGLFGSVERQNSGACRSKLFANNCKWEKFSAPALPTLSVARLRLAQFCCSFAAFNCRRAARAFMWWKTKERCGWSGGLRSAGRSLPLCGQALRAFALARSVTALAEIRKAALPARPPARLWFADQSSFN
jgi:hypothetical protein